LLLNIVEKSLFLTSQVSAEAVGISLTRCQSSSLLQDVMYQKVLRSVDFLPSYSKKRKGWVFWYSLLLLVIR